MKSIFTTAIVCLAACVAAAGEWNNIEEEHWLGGAKITSAAKLQNRVVLVDEWGVNCPPCRELLPVMQTMWQNFGLPANKPFVLIGSHRQGVDKSRIDKLIKANGITYPVYQGAGIAGEPPGDGGLPYMYVLNHRGKVVYRGRDHRLAQEAVIDALGEVGVAPSLTRGATFTKFKTMKKQLVLGKPIKAQVSRLEAAAKSKDSAAAAEARSILDAIERGIAETKEEIECQKEASPKDAVKYIKLLQVTSPADAADYKSGFQALVAKAKAQIAEEKAAAAKKAKK